MRGHRRAGSVPIRTEGRHFTVAAIVGAIVAAAAAGYGAYAASEAQQQAATEQKHAAKQQADAERAAGEAAAARVRYNAAQKQAGFLAREAGSGATVGTGSLLEEEGRFAYNSELNAEDAQFPHKQRAALMDYQSDLFSFQKRQAQKNEATDITIATVAAGGSSLASSYRKKNIQTSNANALADSGTRSSDQGGGGGIIARGYDD